jgi:hypothetical protein
MSSADNLHCKTATQARNAICIVCGGTYAPTQRLPGLVQCNTCGFLSANLSNSDEELRGLYGEGYFKGEEYLDYIAEEPSLRFNFCNRLATLIVHILVSGKATTT